jgi:hypothetical protein
MSTEMLDRICGGFRARLKALLFQAGVARAVVLALVLLPVFMFFDWWLHLGWAWRCLTLLIFLGGVIATIRLTLLGPISGKWSNEQVLSYLDSVTEEGEERGMLLDLYELQHETEVQELSSETGRELARAAVADLSPVVDRVRVGESVHRSAVARWTMVAAALAALVVLAIAIPASREYVGIGTVRFFNPFSGTRWPHRTTITLDEPATGWRVAQMESFPVSAEVSGEVPPTVVLAYQSETTGYWIKEKLRVVKDEVKQADGSMLVRHTIKHQFPEVRENLTFYLEGGDYKTNKIDLLISPRPYLKTIQAKYDYPPYARLRDETKESGQLTGLEGTKVEVTFVSSMKLKRAVYRFEKLTQGDEKKPPAIVEDIKIEDDGKTFKKTIVLKHEGSYQIELHEVKGFREAKPERYEMVVTPDYAPEVDITSPARDLVETNRASIPVAFRYNDDFGIAKNGVQFMYSIDGSKPKALSKLITGPLKDFGKGATARFVWDLRKMRDLPEKCELTYFARVRDVNPVGEAVDSNAYRVKVVPDYVVHGDAVERAKRLMTEARIGRYAQRVAWSRSKQWAEKGTGKEDDPLWLEMVEAQETAVRAARAIDGELQTLTTLYNRNHMGQEFMAVRLSEIGRYVARLSGTEHPKIDSSIREATPRSSLEAAPDALKRKRAAELKKFHKHQRLAWLAYSRVLVKLYDWRDLQTSSITARLLYERQKELRGKTIEIAPRYIGKHILDLTDAEQEDLITLGKRQKAIFDTETELERQLVYTIRKAERANPKRLTIIGPLNYAFKLLRDSRTNYHLKRAAKLIAENQPSQIVKNQTDATTALKSVLRGLVRAGERIDKEMPIEQIVGDPPVVPVDEKRPSDGGPEGPDGPDGPDGPIGPIKEPPPPPPPPPADALATAIYQMIELQDDVVARTRFLGKNLAKDDMPRFRMLTRGALLERQDKAVAMGRLALRHASAAKITAASDVLNLVMAELGSSKGLITGQNYSECTRQMQRDTIALLKHLHQRYLGMRQDVTTQVKVNREGGGLDAFKQPYRLRGANLGHAITVIDRMDYAWMLQADVLHKVERFVKFAKASDRPAALEKKNRLAAAKLQGRVLALIGEMDSALGKVTQEEVFEYEQPPQKKTEKPKKITLKWPIAKELGEAGAAGVKAMRDPLSKVAAMIRKGDADAAIVKDLKDIVAQFGTAVTTTRDLFDAIHAREVVIPEEDKPVDGDGSQPPPPEEDWKRLIDKMKDDDKLPAPMRERMIKAMKELEGREVEHKYDVLLKAYYSSFTRREAGTP